MSATPGFESSPAPRAAKANAPARLALVIGLLGAAAVFGLQSFANIVSYPLNIGGRPPFSWPSFIPIAFEAGILSVVLATVAGAGARCGFLRYYNSVDEIRALREAMIDRWVIVVHAQFGSLGAVARNPATLRRMRNRRGRTLTRALAIIFLCAVTACSDMSEQQTRSYSPLVGPAQTPPSAVTFLYSEPTPPPLTLALIERGQQRFRIFCTPCHSELGNGQGMIVQRGFPEPPSYTSARLLKAPTRHFVDVIAQGHRACIPTPRACRRPIDGRSPPISEPSEKSQNASVEDLAAAQAEAAP